MSTSKQPFVLSFPDSGFPSRCRFCAGPLSQTQPRQPPSCSEQSQSWDSLSFIPGRAFPSFPILSFIPSPGRVFLPSPILSSIPSYFLHSQLFSSIPNPFIHSQSWESLSLIPNLFFCSQCFLPFPNLGEPFLHSQFFSSNSFLPFPILSSIPNPFFHFQSFPPFPSFPPSPILESLSVPRIFG